MDVTEVSDMVRLFNKTFQCLVAFNLDLWETYDQIFYLLCIWRRFLTLEGALEKFPSSGSVDSEIGTIGGQNNFLEGTTCKILDDFNYISRIADGIKFTIEGP